MQFSFPWVLSRKRLITAVLLDGVLFIVLYYILYHWRFAVWPGLSLRLALLLAIWCLCSYVIGRYFSGNEKGHLATVWSIVGRQLMGTGLVLSLTLVITLLHIWLFNQNPAQATFRSFLIPFLGSLAIFSPLIQLSLRRLILFQKANRELVWTYVGALDEFQKLKNSLKWSRLPVCLEHVLPEEINKAYFAPVVVENFYNQSASLISFLFENQQHGSLVLNRIQWCEVVLQRFPSELLRDADLLSGEFLLPSRTLQSRLKRVGDIGVACCILLFASPLLIISIILIKLNDGGPIFYSQIRNGFKGKPFRVWKLRSMQIDAESKGVQWSSRSDPRITRIGRVLRRTRLDELPQLWCVLSGSMSLIGPRPERPEIENELLQSIPYYKLRHQIRPGLSGWAQVNYPYGASIEDSANKLSYDLYYLKNSSFWLDLLILLKTIRLVFNAEGALPMNLKIAKNTPDDKFNQ